MSPPKPDHTPYIFTVVAVALALLLTILFSGCGREIILAPSEVPTRTVALYPEDAARALTNRAAAAINSATGKELVSTAPGGTSVIMGGPDCGQTTLHNGVAVKITVQAGCDRYGKDALAVILVHEIGHAMGLPHSSDPNSVMYTHSVYDRSLDYAAYSLADELRVYFPTP